MSLFCLQHSFFFNLIVYFILCVVHFCWHHNNSHCFHEQKGGGIILRLIEPFVASIRSDLLLLKLHKLRNSFQDCRGQLLVTKLKIAWKMAAMWSYLMRSITTLFLVIFISKHMATATNLLYHNQSICNTLFQSTIAFKKSIGASRHAKININAWNDKRCVIGYLGSKRAISSPKHDSRLL